MPMKKRSPPVNRNTIPAIQMALGSWGEEPQTIKTSPNVKTNPAVQQQNNPRLKYRLGVLDVKYDEDNPYPDAYEELVNVDIVLGGEDDEDVDDTIPGDGEEVIFGWRNNSR